MNYITKKFNDNVSLYQYCLNFIYKKFNTDNTTKKKLNKLPKEILTYIEEQNYDLYIGCALYICKIEEKSVDEILLVFDKTNKECIIIIVGEDSVDKISYYGSLVELEENDYNPRWYYNYFIKTYPDIIDSTTDHIQERRKNSSFYLISDRIEYKQKIFFYLKDINIIPKEATINNTILCMEEYRHKELVSNLGAILIIHIKYLNNYYYHIANLEESNFNIDCADSFKYNGGRCIECNRAFSANDNYNIIDVISLFKYAIYTKAQDFDKNIKRVTTTIYCDINNQFNIEYLLSQYANDHRPVYIITADNIEYSHVMRGIRIKVTFFIKEDSIILLKDPNSNKIITAFEVEVNKE